MAVLGMKNIIGCSVVVRNYDEKWWLGHPWGDMLLLFFVCCLDLLSIREYHALACIICADFPLMLFQKTAK